MASVVGYVVVYMLANTLEVTALGTVKVVGVALHGGIYHQPFKSIHSCLLAFSVFTRAISWQLLMNILQQEWRKWHATAIYKCTEFTCMWRWYTMRVITPLHNPTWVSINLTNNSKQTSPSRIHSFHSPLGLHVCSSPLTLISLMNIECQQGSRADWSSC